MYIGIIPNAINDVFQYIEEKKISLALGEKWDVNLSYIEVCNEQCIHIHIQI
jgi:hypothetical protein